MSTLSTTNIKHPSSASNNIVLDSSGRVGVGTSSPHATLQVHDGTFVLSKPAAGSERNWRILPSDAVAGDLAIQQSTTAGGTTYATKLTIDPSGNLQFNSGYGSVATAYGCRAWVNFNGTFGTSPFTIANGGIRASGNVSSITDNGTGDYTVNFTTAMPDANYCTVGTGTANSSSIQSIFIGNSGQTTTNVRVLAAGSAYYDDEIVNVAIFR